MSTMDFDDELFGDAEQIAVQRRALALWNLVRDDPRFGFHGRFVTVLGDQDKSLDWLMSLACLLLISTVKEPPISGVMEPLFSAQNGSQTRL